MITLGHQRNANDLLSVAQPACCPLMFNRLESLPNQVDRTWHNGSRVPCMPSKQVLHVPHFLFLKQSLQLLPFIFGTCLWKVRGCEFNWRLARLAWNLFQFLHVCHGSEKVIVRLPSSVCWIFHWLLPVGQAENNMCGMVESSKVSIWFAHCSRILYEPRQILTLKKTFKHLHLVSHRWHGNGWWSEVNRPSSPTGLSSEHANTKNMYSK